MKSHFLKLGCVPTILFSFRHLATSMKIYKCLEIFGDLKRERSEPAAGRPRKWLVANKKIAFFNIGYNIVQVCNLKKIIGLMFFLTDLYFLLCCTQILVNSANTGFYRYK